MGTLRLALAVIVALTHAGFVSLSVAGFSFSLDAARAVQGFFVISGFYMAMILEGPYRNDVLKFYLNRALRIFPMYWIVAAAVAIFTTRVSALAGEPLAVLANVFLFGQQTILATSDAGRLLVPPAWSLGVELMFYLLAPFLARRSSFQLFILAIALSPFRGDIHSWIGQMPLFLVGMLIYRAKIIPSYRSALDSWIGDLSYPVYLVHYPVLRALEGEPVLALALTAVLSVALKIVTLPIEKIRAQIKQRQHPVGLHDRDGTVQQIA